MSPEHSLEALLLRSEHTLILGINIMIGGFNDLFEPFIFQGGMKPLSLTLLKICGPHLNVELVAINQLI